VVKHLFAFFFPQTTKKKTTKRGKKIFPRRDLKLLGSTYFHRYEKFLQAGALPIAPFGIINLKRYVLV
jgi:hypothetical protein